MHTVVQDELGSVNVYCMSRSCKVRHVYIPHLEVLAAATMDIHSIRHICHVFLDDSISVLYTFSYS